MDGEAYEGWGKALAEKLSYDEAIAKYQQAIKLDPKNSLYRLVLDDAEATRNSR
jgi:hypothetical protein